MSEPTPDTFRPVYVLDTLPRYPEGDEIGDFRTRTYVQCGESTPIGTPLLAGGCTILVVTEADVAQRLCRLLNRVGNLLAHGQLDNGDLAFSIGIDAAYQLEDILRDMGITLVPPPA